MEINVACDCWTVTRTLGPRWYFQASVAMGSEVVNQNAVR